MTFDIVEDTRGALAAAVLQLTRATVGTSSRSTDADGGGAGGATLRFDRGWARQSTPKTTTTTTTTTTEAPKTTSIVYVVDDSGSMDFGFPEVRTALETVRDEAMDHTKVALIAYGKRPKTLFELQDHSSAPWDSHINNFSGRRGGTWTTRALAEARDILKADTADTKKIILLTDGVDGISSDTFAATFTEAGIKIDTVAFGEDSIYVTRVQETATNTGGTYLGVKKPTSATENDPVVSATSMATILKGSVAENTATLFLVDESRSMKGPTRSLDSSSIQNAITQAASKASSTTGAQVGVAEFLGHGPTSSSGYTETSLALAYTVSYAIGSTPDRYQINGYSWAFGSTNVDYALNQAFTTVSSATPTNKRVVLITDGITEEAVKAATLTKYANNSNVSLYVVAWGDHADRAALKSWADDASGTYYVAS